MKIAHIVDSMEVGGAETLVAQLCRLQRSQGHDPEVYAVGQLGDLGVQLQREGFVVRAKIALHLTDAWPAFTRLFRAIRPEAVHLHNPTPSIYAAWPARWAGVPSIIATRHSLVAPPRRLVAELKFAAAALACDWVVGICQATLANLRDIHSASTRKLVCVYNGTEPVTQASPAQHPPKCGFTFVFLGRLAAVKNLQHLLRAFQIALRTQPDLRLWLVGDGSDRPLLEKLASELGITAQVTFWGQHLDVAPFLSAADAFLMSSHSEGLPMSLLQAFSLGLPAIVTDVGGMAEVVRLAQAGRTVSLIDPAEMATAMLQLAADEDARKQLSANASAAFEQHFTLTAMADAYLNLYCNTPRARRKV